jgi:hypothetical protein
MIVRPSGLFEMTPVASRDFGAGNRAISLDDPDGNVVELTARATN